MQEVANSAVQFALNHARTHFDVDPAALLEPLLSEPDILARDPMGRIPWVTFAAIFDHLETTIGGRTRMQSFFETGNPWIERGRRGGIAGLFKDSRDLFRYVATAFVPRHFSNIECVYSENADGSVTLQAWLPIEYRDSPPFWWAVAGLLRILPGYIGQSEALVDPQVSDRQATYRITPPPVLTIIARLRNSLKGFFALQSAADLAAEQGKELAWVHQTLVETRRQLEREIVEASSLEQQRIARDLHDGLGQQLTAISLQVKLLEGILEKEAPELAPEVAQLLLEIKEAAILARNLSHGLDAIGSRVRPRSTR